MFADTENKERDQLKEFKYNGLTFVDVITIVILLFTI